MKPVSTLPSRKLSARQSAPRKATLRAHAGDKRVIERIRQPIERGLARRRMRDELGDHRIVERRHLAAGFHPALHAHIGRQVEADDRAGRGQEAVLRIFGIDPRFDRVTVEADLLLRQRQLFARRDPELPGDEIEPGDLFGHRMLDLKPRIHFDEPEAVRPQSLAAVGDELDRAGADIADRPRRLDRRRAHLGAQCFASFRAPAFPR